MVRLAKLVKCTYISKCFSLCLGAAHVLFRKIYKNLQCIHDRIFWIVAVRDDFQHRALYLWSHLACHPSIIGSQIAYCTGKPREEIEACSVQNDCVDHMQIDISSPSSACKSLQISLYCRLKLICGSSCCVPATWSILEQPWREGCV